MKIRRLLDIIGLQGDWDFQACAKEQVVENPINGLQLDMLVNEFVNKTSSKFPFGGSMEYN